MAYIITLLDNFVNFYILLIQVSRTYFNFDCPYTEDSDHLLSGEISCIILSKYCFFFQSPHNRESNQDKLALIITPVMLKCQSLTLISMLVSPLSSLQQLSCQSSSLLSPLPSVLPGSTLHLICTHPFRQYPVFLLDILRYE